MSSFSAPPPLPLLTLHITARAISAATLPEFKGSLLRGVLGHALKRTVCVFPRREVCTGCPLLSQCGYPTVFGEALTGDNTDAPLFMMACDDGTRSFTAGQVLEFQLTVIGDATNWLLHILTAMEEGIGTRGFTIVAAKQKDATTIYTPEGLWLTPKPQVVSIAPGEVLTPEVTSIQINLISPLRVKSRGALTSPEELTFATIVGATLRRISTLWQTCTGTEPKLPYRELNQVAQLVTQTDAELRWYEQMRYSGRQHRHLLIGGISGQVTYQSSDNAPLAPFLPILKLGEVLHIGKQVSFGLGRIEVTSS